MASTISDVSFISWASAATECTNPTFKTALSRPWPNISMHRDVLSVLAAVTKTIKDNGGKESPTEYYAALLTLINESSEKVAVAYLLKLVMCKAVEDSLLRKTCGEAAKTLIKLLSSHNINTDACLIKSVLTCLGKLLRAQSYDSWSTESIRHVYRHVLRFVDSEKPSIRKSCHSSIVDILGSLNVVSLTGDVIFHPACHQTQEHLCSVIRQETRQLISSLHTKDVHCTRLLHCLDLLTSIMPLLPSKDVKLAFECVLELANFPNPLVVTKVFHSFKTMFDSKPSLKTLPIDIAARLLTALYSCRPNDPNVFTISSTNNTCTGVDALVSWMLALISGCAYLCGLSLLAVKTEDNELKKTIENVERFSIQRLANEHLDRLVKTLMSLLISTPLPQLREPVTQKLNQLFTEVVHPQLVSCQLADILPDFIPNVLCNFITGLQYTHYEIWNHMLCLIGRFTMIISKVFPFDTMLNFNSLVELLKVILHLRDCLVDGPKSLINLIHVDPENFSLIGLNDLGEKIIDGLDSVCLLAVEYIGPELILPGNIFSLEIIVEELETGKIDLQRSWFLPLLSRAVPQRSISLSIFHRHILPLADRALAVASLHSSTTVLSDKTKPPNNALITSSIKVACQLWSSLNMFVHHSPIDWSELSTGGLGSRLVKELSSAPALRPIILHTFRRLAKLAVGNDPAITVMRGGAKTAIPNMLSLYETLDTVTQHSLKQKIQATLSYYLPILSPKMISSLTKTAMIKFENTKEPVYLEIFQILIAYNSVQELEQIITRINEYLNDVQLSKPLRKRVCRVLESICAGSTSQTDEFLNLHFNDVIHMIYGLTKKPVTNNSTTVTSLTDKKSLKTDNNLTQTIEEKLTTLSVCEMKIGKPMKLSQFFIPWKSILRCIQHLFKRLVTNELNTIINTNQSSDDDLTTKNLMDNERLKEFANMFLPEGLLSVEHQKMVRNSVKLMARRERKSKMLEESTSKTTPSSSSLFSGSTRRQISDSDSDHTPKRSISSDIKSIRSSIHSKPSSLSLPKRVHITRMDELLATSSSDDDRSSIHSHAKSNRSQTRSSSCGSSLKNTKSLVEELENAKLTAGLCRRSRRNLTENGSFNMIDNMDIDFGAYSENDDDDDEEINKALCKNPFKSKHQVRFAADTISHTSKPRSQVSRHTSLSAVTAASSRHPPSNDSDLWLVENPESSEILDLSDPKSLARHTAFAPDDMTAKAMVNIFQNSLAEQSKSSASQSINKHNDQPFPIVNGKIVINDGTIDENQSILTKKDHLEWDLDGDDDNDANIQSTSCVNKNDIKHRKKKTIPIPGRIYASSKARGDMKRAGMPEPFAFVPLGAGIGKSNNSISQRVTPLERRRLLREVGMGKQKRKRIQGGKHMKSSKNIVLKDVHKKTKFLKLSKAKFPRDNM